MTADDIQTALSDIQFDQLVLETAGTPQTVSLAIDIAGPRAQLALVGTLHHDLTLTTRTFGLILRKELTLLGSWMNYSAPWPGEEWETAARLLAEKRLQLTLSLPIAAMRKALQKQSKRLMARPCRAKFYFNFPDGTSQQPALAHISFRNLAFTFRNPSFKLVTVNYQANQYELI